MFSDRDSPSSGDGDDDGGRQSTTAAAHGKPGTDDNLCPGHLYRRGVLYGADQTGSELPFGVSWVPLPLSCVGVLDHENLPTDKSQL